MFTANSLTTCVLLYGDHADLAARSLESILQFQAAAGGAVRVCVNDIGDDTRRYLRQLCAEDRLSRRDIYDAGENVHKYPMLRAMLYGKRALTTSHLLWLDDDSFIRDPRHFAKVLPELLAVLDSGVAMLGRLYSQGFQGQQRTWVSQQPWYRGRAWQRVRGEDRMFFCTGGGWLARTNVLREVNWPWPELDHSGGDHLLGACLHQRGATIERLPSELLAVNADENGAESKAALRGFNGRRPLPLGASAVPTVPPVITQWVPFT